jgi:hypothetical protein
MLKYYLGTDEELLSFPSMKDVDEPQKAQRSHKKPSYWHFCALCDLCGQFSYHYFAVGPATPEYLHRRGNIIPLGAFFSCSIFVLVNNAHTNANVAADWLADMDASLDLSDVEKQGFGFLLSWFESYRMRKGLRADRPTAVLFWREQVVVKPHKQWQLDRWAEAVSWYLRLQECCRESGVGSRESGVGSRESGVGSRESGVGSRLGAWSADLHWGAHAPRRLRVATGASHPRCENKCHEQALPVDEIRLAGIATTFADESGVLKLDVRLRKTKTREELMALLDRLQGQHRLAAELQ